MKISPQFSRSTAALALFATAMLAGCNNTPSDPFAAATQALSQGEPRTAFVHAKAALEANPNDSQTLMLVADVAMALGNPLRAITELEKVPNDAAEAPLAQARLAEAHLTAGQLKQAGQVLAQINQPTGLSNAISVELLFAKADYEEGFQVLEAALSDTPNEARLITLDAQRLVLTGQEKQAWARLNPVLASDTPPYQAHVLAGRMSMSARALQDAQSHFEAVLKARPAHHASMLAMVAIARDLGDKDLAKNWLAKINSSGAVHPIALTFAAQMALEGGDVDKAFALVEQIPAASAKGPDVSRLRGFIAAARGNREDAISALQRYLSKSDGDPLARHLLAENLAANGELGTAWEVLAPAIDNPSLDGAGLALALKLAEQTGRGDASAIAAKIAQRANSPQIAEEMRKAGVLIRAGDWAGADRLYAPLVEGDGRSNPVLLNNAAAVKSKLGEHDEAVALARRALNAAPKSPEVMDTLGWALWQVDGGKQEARQLLSQARQLAPKNQEIAKHYAAAHADL
jgi:tetratricopeptide (TPR) repeat protein